MSTTWKWVIGIGIGVLLIAGATIWWKKRKKSQIRDAALKTGAPASVAENIANSTDPAGAARQAGFSAPIADAISQGYSVVSANANPNQTTGTLKYTGTGTFYSCQEPAIRKETGTKDANGNPLYDCYIEVESK